MSLSLLMSCWVKHWLGLVILLTPSTGALALAYLFNPFIECIS